MNFRLNYKINKTNPIIGKKNIYKTNLKISINHKIKINNIIK